MINFFKIRLIAIFVFLMIFSIGVALASEGQQDGLIEVGKLNSEENFYSNNSSHRKSDRALNVLVQNKSVENINSIIYFEERNKKQGDVLTVIDRRNEIRSFSTLMLYYIINIAFVLILVFCFEDD